MFLCLLDFRDLMEIGKVIRDAAGDECQYSSESGVND